MKLERKLTIAVLILIVLLPFLTACSAPARNELESFNFNHKVELISGGDVVQEWESKGRVLSRSDNHLYFEDTTGAHIEIMGTVVITRIK